MRPLRVSKSLVLSAAMLSLFAAVVAAPRRGLGRPQTPAAAKKIDLLKSPPFDRITLTDNTVWEIEPVSPRPLPEYDAAREKRKLEAGGATKVGLPTKGNIGVAEKEPPKTAKEEELLRPELVIHLTEGEVRDFRVKRINIRKIEYFEDMLLAEADRLLLVHDYARAFEHFVALMKRDPKWKGLEEGMKKLLYEEGSAALREGNRDKGLRLLRELHSRESGFPGLTEKLSQAYGSRIDDSYKRAAYPASRRILHDLETLNPDHLLAKEAKLRLEGKAKDLMNAAATKPPAEKVDLLAESLRVWPKLEAAEAPYREAFQALPTLDVAVMDLAKPIAPWARSPASERVARLVYLPILAKETEEAARGKVAGQLASNLEISDIGRRIDVTIRPGVQWSDGSRTVSSLDVVRSLADRAMPSSPSYNARWADLLERVEPVDERLVTLRLSRPYLKPELWLLAPVGPAHAAWDGRVPTADGKRLPTGDGPYYFESNDEHRMTFLVAKSNGSAASENGNGAQDSAAQSGPRIARIREQRFPSAHAALSALLRGDVTMVELVPSDRVAALQADPELRVGRYERLGLHRIALDGRAPALHNRSLRRAISYAIDRQTILEELVIRRAIDAENAPSDGPLGTDSYGNAPEVKPLGYDFVLAKQLFAAARRELGGNPIKLTLEYPARPEAQAAIPRIVESLRAIGLVIEPIERAETELEEGLRSGRRFDLAYRVSRCVEPAWEMGPLLCPGYDAPPASNGIAALASPRILQLLLQLEHAQDFTVAKALVIQIDRESRDELPIIPLWQLRDHFAWRARLKGPAEQSDTLYEGITQWQIEPWFAKDPW